MDFIRVYTDEQGLSQFEDMDPTADAAWVGGFPVGNCVVRPMAVGLVMDWHPAPRRQLVIHLSGQLEIVLGDGTAHLFGPGSARLMDDITGSGHLTRVVGAEPAIQAVMPLTE